MCCSAAVSQLPHFQGAVLCDTVLRLQNELKLWRCCQRHALHVSVAPLTHLLLHSMPWHGASGCLVVAWRLQQQHLPY